MISFLKNKFYSLIRLINRKYSPNKNRSHHIKREINTSMITHRIKGLGWILIERPITAAHDNKLVIKKYKVIAIRGDKSVEITGPTRKDAIENIGKLLGVISNK